MVILRVTVSIRALTLKILGIISGTATTRIATVLICLEHGARVVATAISLELAGTLSDDVGGAANGAGAPVRGGAELHGNIETVDEGDVVEVKVVVLVECEFGEGVGWCTVCRALEVAAAVTGLAVAVS